MKDIEKYIIFAIILFAVQGLWVSLELLFYGEIQPQTVDNVIAFIFTISLYHNFKTWLADFRRFKPNDFIKIITYSEELIKVPYKTNRK